MSRQAPCCGWSCAAILIGREVRHRLMLDLPLRGKSTYEVMFPIGLRPPRRDQRQAAARLRWARHLRAGLGRSGDRYRRYSPAQLPELRRILALRQLGMRLDEIGELIRGGDLRAALERRRAELERERRLVEERLAALDISVGGHADVVVRPLAVEPVAPSWDHGSVARCLLRARGARPRPRPEGASAARRVPSRRLIFVPVTGPSPRPIGLLPSAAGGAGRIRDPSGRTKGSRRSRDAARWVDASGLAPSGPMRTIYLQFGADPELGIPPGWVVERSADLVTELQLPVE